MAILEDIKPNCAVRGILPSSVVTAVSVQWFGSDAIELTYKDATGRVGNELVYRDREADLEIVEEGRPWSFDGDGALFRLVAEAQRIHLARLFDPALAVHRFGAAQLFGDDDVRVSAIVPHAAGPQI